MPFENNLVASLKIALKKKKKTQHKRRKDFPSKKKAKPWICAICSFEWQRVLRRRWLIGRVSWPCEFFFFFFLLRAYQQQPLVKRRSLRAVKRKSAGHFRARWIGNAPGYSPFPLSWPFFSPGLSSHAAASECSPWFTTGTDCFFWLLREIRDE